MAKLVQIVGLQDAQGLVFSSEEAAKEYLRGHSHMTNTDQLIQEGQYTFQEVEVYEQAPSTTVKVDADSEAYKRLGNTTPEMYPAKDVVEHVVGKEETKRELPIPEQPAGPVTPVSKKARDKAQKGIVEVDVPKVEPGVGDKPEDKQK